MSVAPAAAQVDQRSEAERAAPQTWNVTIGARLGAQPEFLGSKDSRFFVRPQFSMGRGLGNRWFSAEDDNISIGLVNGDIWRAGLTGVLAWERREKDSGALRGLGNTKFGGEAGVFAELYVTPWLRARADLRHGFVAHSALMADLKLDAFTSLGNGWSLALGPRMTLAGDDYMDTYFGVDALQAQRSGLRQHNPAGGVLSYGVAAQVGYRWTPRITTTASIQYNRLAGDAANAPLVRDRGSRDQLTVGVATRWSIDTGY
jgi:outer membrane scaffolding protein for murein synthesis (MipA/OmpV family)